MLMEKRSIYKQSFHDELEELAEQGQEQDVQEQAGLKQGCKVQPGEQVALVAMRSR